MIRVRYDRNKLIYINYGNEKLDECLSKLKEDCGSKYGEATWNIVERFFACVKQHDPVKYRLICSEVFSDKCPMVVEIQCDSQYIYGYVGPACEYDKTEISKGTPLSKWSLRRLFSSIRSRWKDSFQ